PQPEANGVRSECGCSLESDSQSLRDKIAGASAITHPLQRGSTISLGQHQRQQTSASGPTLPSSLAILFLGQLAEAVLRWIPYRCLCLTDVHLGTARSTRRCCCC
ncbi:unnamed protein product, partial [Ectocarpus sp. 4 AP-2014]